MLHSRKQTDFPFQHRLSGQGERALRHGTGMHPCQLEAIIHTGGGIRAKHGTSLPENGNNPQPRRPGALLVPEGGSDPPHTPGSWDGATASGIRHPPFGEPLRGRKIEWEVCLLPHVHYKRDKRDIRDKRDNLKKFFQHAGIPAPWLSGEMLLSHLGLWSTPSS